MLDEVSYSHAVRVADHYLATGQREVYLFKPPFPWEHVTKCEPGGSHRLEIATSVTFIAVDPCGLSFRWSFDIEEREANGTGSYKVKVSEIQQIANILPAAARKTFNKYLLDCAKAIEEKGNEYQRIAQDQWNTAAALRAATHQ